MKPWQAAQTTGSSTNLPPVDALRLLDGMPDLMLWLVAGEIRWVSPSAQEVLGWTPAELIGTDHRALVHPADLADLDQAFATVLDRGPAFPLEHRMRCADSTWVRVATTWRQLTSAGSQPEWILAVRRIDDNRDRLQWSEMQWVSLFDHAPIGMVVADADGRYVHVNRAACVLFGRDEQNLIGRTWQDTTAVDEIAGELARRAAAESDGTDLYSIRKDIVRPSGEWRIVDVECLSSETPLGGWIGRSVRWSTSPI